ncbi:MAG: hypothetical protein ISS78_06880 [Phycisphaerae bacterium]|nr:hypothetical protein [Phycisphaerae bacterium]
MRQPLLSPVVLSALLLTGCVPQEGNRVEIKEEKLLSQVRKLEREKDGLQTVIIDQQKQIRNLQALGQGKRLERLFHVSRIELGRYTGGVDTNGLVGHDAIKVFLRPIDQDGSTVKAAGDVKIQIYDLALPADENLIGEYEWPVDKISKHWSGGFMTYYFSFVCPWKKASLPKHNELTVRVEFVDYLTGKTFTAQKACEVRVKPTPTTATKPAK